MLSVSVGQSIDVRSYGLYLLCDGNIGYSAIILKGYNDFKLVSEQYTGARKYTYVLNQDNQLIMTLEGDLAGALKIWSFTYQF